MTEAMAVILAAGEGKRMGLPKALLEYEKGRTFLAHLTSTFAKSGCEVRVVVGKHAEDIVRQHPDAHILENPDWAAGQFSSIKLGLRAALDDKADVILLHPVDMPFIRASTIAALLRELDGNDGAVPEFEGAVGHPLALSRAAAEKVLAMDDVPHMEAAQKRLSIVHVRTKDPSVLVDLNTPDAYERLLGTPPHLAPPRKRRARA